MSCVNILLAGFGGQGVLFAGKFLAYKGLIENKYVSWLPSYGPEMRGGTANCSVIISDKPIGSPIVDKPDALIAMNLPSLDKYEDKVVSGGKIFIDSTLVSRKVERSDVDAYYVPATAKANEKNISALANMIITGKALKEVDYLCYNNLEAALEKTVSVRRRDMLSFNLDALNTGYGL